MATLQALLFLSSLLVQTRADCQSSTCSEGGVSIRFPFGLENQQSFLSCAYNPLFSLRCSNSSTSSQDSPVVFNLPSSGDFCVRNINYSKQEIQLYDPLNCLPKRFLKLDLLFSPFGALNYSNYTFLRCPKYAVKDSFSVIHCLSNSTVSVLATSSMSVVRAMNMCETYVADLRVPVSQSGQTEDWFSSDLTQDFKLRWNSPDCRSCEVQGGVCAFAPFADYTTPDIGCTYDFTPPTGNSRRKMGTRIFLISASCIVLPGVFFIACLGCFTYVRNKLHTRRYYRSSSITRTRPEQNPRMATTMTSTQTPQATSSRLNDAMARARPVQNPQMATTTASMQTPQSTSSHLNDSMARARPVQNPQMATTMASMQIPQSTSSHLNGSMVWTTALQNPEMATTQTTQTAHNTSSCWTNLDLRLYTPMVFEDSQRLPRPGENACIICHDKYLPKEILGLVNGCQHSFHAHCLESWLQRSPTCPLCRNSLPS